MFENIKKILKKGWKKEPQKSNTKTTAKERLHLVLMQDRANVSADFLDLMRKEIIEVIKKYIDIDEEAMDVRLTTEADEEGKQGAPALYANIPIINIKDETRKLSKTNQENKTITQSNNIKTKTEDEAKKDTEKDEKETSKQTKENKQTSEQKAEGKEDKKQSEKKSDDKIKKTEEKKEKSKQEDTKKTTKSDNKKQENPTTNTENK